MSVNNNKEEIDDFFSEELIENFCYSLSNDCIKNGENEIVYKYYSQKIIPYTVNYVGDQMLKMVKYVLLKKGMKENFSSSSWKPDKQPSRIPTDSLSKGSIPILYEGSDRGIKKKRSGNFRKKKRKSKLSLSSSRVSSSSSFSNRQSVNTSAMNTGVNTSTKRSRAHSVRKSKALSTKNPSKRKKKFKMQKAMVEKETRKMEDIKRQLRGKDYTYDQNGDVIVINKINPSYLPSNRINPKINVVTKKKKTPKGRKKKGYKNSKKKMKKSYGITKKKPSALLDEQNIVSSNIAPMIDNFKPSSGVVFKKSNKVVKGPSIKVDPSMTMKDRKVVSIKSQFTSSPRKKRMEKMKMMEAMKKEKELERKRKELEKTKEKEEPKQQIENNDIDAIPVPYQQPARLKLYQNNSTMPTKARHRIHKKLNKKKKYK